MHVIAQGKIRRRRAYSAIRTTDRLGDAVGVSEVVTEESATEDVGRFRVHRLLSAPQIGLRPTQIRAGASGQVPEGGGQA